MYDDFNCPLLQFESNLIGFNVEPKLEFLLDFCVDVDVDVDVDADIGSSFWGYRTAD